MRRRARINQIVADFSRKPLSESRVLDLASLEGHFSAELATRGANVVGIEGRSNNLKSARELFSFPNLEFVQDDVRNLSREKYGTFDIVLCLGILYHLDAPDCFRLLESIAEVCDGLAIIDTHTGLTRHETVTYKGREYRGFYFTEFESEPTPEQEEESVWSSIKNLRSFWLSKPSLINAIIEAGFTSVYECQFPACNDQPVDRVSLVAVKGKRERVLAVPFDEAILGERAVEELPLSFQLAEPETLYRRTRARAGKVARRLRLRK
jgi:hypothetical protein